ncbi:MAG: ethanolamine utilization protein EutJ [Firmicutes bacterium HGW-Firmicutes-7]|nr:MAG: ethanolamine utilization protein EutJ [Firmicutes bacterium HGW-Firmicutes-7]
MDIDRVNQDIKAFEILIEDKICGEFTGELFTGVDLGTAYIVLSVVDKNGKAIAGAKKRASVVKDGVVVDYIGAIKIVRELKRELEEIIGIKLLKAATAIPPGVSEGSVKAIVNVVEACEFEVVNVVDEPTAAAKVLCVKDGAVVDVGGGTTGISVIESGNVTFTADEATGGHHMNLVLAGRYNLNYEEAEILKHTKDREWDVFPVIAPVVEKMASIVNRFIYGKEVSTIYIVGGAATFVEFEKVFTQKTGLMVIKPYNPMLVTPLGIALSCLSEVK